MSGPSKPQLPYTRLTLIALAAVIALGGVPVAVWVGSSEGDAPSDPRSSLTAFENEVDGSGPQNRRSSSRPEAGPKATHGPHQLRDFYLPPLDFEGKSLEEALAMVRAAYEQACRDSGEHPLQVVFKVPPGVNPVLHAKTRCRTLGSTVHLLAGAAKLSVSRHGKEYRFASPAKGNGKMMHREFVFPPDSGVTSLLAQLGIVLDPSTTVTNRPGGVTIESTNPGDLAAVDSITQSLAMDPRISQVLTTKIVKLQAGLDWQHADQSMMSDTEVQSLMRECASRKGVELRTLPSITARAEENATIEIVRDLMVKSDDPAGGFEAHPVGVVLNASLHPLGFGVLTKADLSITDGEVNQRTGRPVIDQQAAVSVESFAPDAGTLVKVQNHPDGTRTVLLLSPVLVDATGAPARAREKP